MRVCALSPARRPAAAHSSAGSTESGCYATELDFTIPTSAQIGPARPARCPPAEGPASTFFYIGKRSSAVRNRIAQEYEHDAAFFKAPKRLDHAAYLCAMARATFCLAPRGQAGWSPRLDEVRAASTAGRARAY